ncbi:TetR/AcrR family transcriptional regulator [Luteipulveratus mongoliensis]|uniref:HTH tetR-type domain-containing protein n=1 Tax=Luteipulveratus mongoliensis TaxID=571913 RepID=A0A0K1JEQ2_9MICO|nr:TetR family transcriptional regulator C-terminal domain-containing protein [Luteipulveratus mongoliensis]AKU15192.1 hypothetical protein VV02_03815 [Luteipulveratus mongoliensis]
MPKVVDSQERRRVVFDAVYDVIVEQGIAQVSLQRVASAADLAVGSVRHYFASQEVLLSEAATELIDRVSARLEQHRAQLDDGAEPLDVAKAMFAEMLPLNATTSREVTVWLEYNVAARTTPSLRPAARELHQGLRTLARIAVGATGPRPAAQFEVEVERLAALVDGLAMAATLYPRDLTRKGAKETLDRHLDQLWAG